MADAVSTQVLVNNARNLIIKCDSLSDGSGETAVKKYDAASSTYATGGQVPGVHSALKRVQWNVKGMGLQMLWEATSNQQLMYLGSDTSDDQDFGRLAGLLPPSVAGVTGSILFTTKGAAANSGYSVILHILKNVPTA